MPRQSSIPQDRSVSSTTKKKKVLSFDGSGGYTGGSDTVQRGRRRWKLMDLAIFVLLLLSKCIPMTKLKVDIKTKTGQCTIESNGREFVTEPLDYYLDRLALHDD